MANGELLSFGEWSNLRGGGTSNEYDAYKSGTDTKNPSFNTSGLQTGLQGIQALTGLANAYVGYKGLGLAKDQFNFQKSAANRDIANQAKLINESRLNSGNVGLALAGNTMSEGQKQAARNKIATGNVDGSRIG